MALIYETTKNKVYQTLLLITILVSLVSVSGFRWKVGTDFPIYYSFFSWFPDANFSIFFSETYESLIPYERGFSMLVWLIGLINKDPQFIMFILATLTIVPIVITIKKYSISFSLSIFLYITTMSYYSSFNGIRQWIASMILFVALKYVYERQIYKYLIVVCLATFVHSSAIIFIGVYFFVNLKAWSKRILIISFTTLVALLAFPNVLNLLTFITPSEFHNYLHVVPNGNGINFLRILVAAIPIIISFFFYRKLKIIDNKVDILINFSLLNLIFKLLAINMNIINRFSLYFSIFIVLLIPLFIKLFKNEDRLIIKVIIMILFLLYMILLLPAESDLLPYISIFNK